MFLSGSKADGEDNFRFLDPTRWDLADVGGIVIVVRGTRHHTHYCVDGLCGLDLPKVVLILCMLVVASMPHRSWLAYSATNNLAAPCSGPYVGGHLRSPGRK